MTAVPCPFARRGAHFDVQRGNRAVSSLESWGGKMNGGSQDVGNVVETRKGRFEGASLSEEGRVVRTFKGIPYVAPAGDLTRVPERADPSA